MRLFLHDDFDGLASAALVLAWLRDVHELDPDTVRLELVDHPVPDRWHSPIIAPDDDNCIIVDYSYHPSAWLWFDHHRTTFLSSEYAEDFASRYTSFSAWNPAYASCAQLIFDRLRETWLEHGKYADLVAAANKIDSARYESPDEYFDSMAPEILLNHAWRELTEPEKMTTVRHLAKHGLLATSRTVTTVAQRVRERNHEALYRYPDHLTMIGDVACVDLVDGRLPFLRYATYYLRRDVRHTLTLYKPNDLEVCLSLGRNPWLDFTETDPDLGALAKRHGGGGHAYAAACTFPANGTDYGDARRVMLVLARELMIPDAQAVA